MLASVHERWLDERLERGAYGAAAILQGVA